MNKKEIQRLKDIGCKEERPLSGQVVYMMNHYIDNIPILKKYLEEKERKHY